MQNIIKKIKAKEKEIAKRYLAISTIAILMLQFLPMATVEAADLFTTKANIAWVKTIESSRNDNFNSFIPIDVSGGTGYIAVGNTATVSAASDGDIPGNIQNTKGTNAIISKVVMKDGAYDSQQSWTKRFGGTAKSGFGDCFSAVVKATHNSGGYVAAGYCNLATPKGDLNGLTPRAGSKTALAEKFNEDGTVAWSIPLVVGGNTNSEFTGITETSDGDFIAVGYTAATTTNDFSGTNSYGNNDAIIVKINGQTGQKEWLKRYGTSGSDGFTAIKSTASGYVISGYVDASGDGVFNANSTFQLDKNGSSDAVVALISNSGDITKIKNIGGSGKEQFNGIVTSSDGGITAVGILNSTSISNLPNGVDNVELNNNSQDGFIAKFDEDLNIKWVRAVGNSMADNLYSISDTGDGYVAAGDTQINYIGAGFVVKLGYSGNVTNANVFFSDNIKKTCIKSIFKEGSDGYVIAGNTNSTTINDKSVNLNGTGAGNYTDALLAKFNYEADERLANQNGIYSDDSSIIYNNPISNAPAIKWFTDLGGSGSDSFDTNKVLELSDKSYIAAGNVDAANADGFIASKNSPYGSYSGIVSKFTTNSEGKNLADWTTYMPGKVCSIAKAEDGNEGFITAGQIGYSTTGYFANMGVLGKYYGYALKVNSDGTVDDTKKYIMSVPGSISNIECSKDKAGNIDGYFAIESISKDNGSVAGTAIIKLDKNLNAVATETLFTDSNTSIFSITQDKAGDYVLAGWTESDKIGGISTDYTSGSAQDAVIVKVDSETCKIKAVNRIGGSFDDGYNSVQSTEDGGVIAAGYTESSDGDMDGRYGNLHHGIGAVNADDGLVVKYDKDMNIEWIRQIGGNGMDCVNSVCQAADGSYVAVGTSASTSDDFSGMSSIVGVNKLQPKAFIAKISEEKDHNGEFIKDSDGKAVTALNINILNPDFLVLYFVSATSDGGYIAAGRTIGTDNINGIKTSRFSDDSRGSDCLIMKFSKTDDLDGDGMPNERDYYPNDPSKSYLDVSNSKDLGILNAIDVDKTNIKQTVTGVNSGSVYSAAVAHDDLKYLSAGLYGNNGDSEAVDLDNVETAIPVQFLDSIIGKNFSSKITFAKNTSSNSKITAEKEAAASEKDAFVDSFDLGVNKDSSAVESFAGKVKVTVNLSSEKAEELKHSGTPKLYKYNETDKKLEDTNASFDLEGKKAVFYTTQLAGSYTIVLPESKTTTFNGAAEGQDGLYKASGYVDFMPDSGNILINFSNLLSESISAKSLSEKISSGSFNFEYTNVISDEETKRIKIIAPSSFTYLENAASDISLTNDSGESIKKLGDSFEVTMQLSDSVLNDVKTAKGTKKPKLYFYNKDVGILEDVNSIFDLDNKTVTFSTKQFGTYVVGLYQTNTFNAGTKEDDGMYTANGDINCMPNTGNIEFNFNNGSFVVNMPSTVLKNKIGIGGSTFELRFLDTITADDVSKLEGLRSKNFSYIGGGGFEISLLNGTNSVHELGDNTVITLKLSSAVLAVIKASQSVMIPKVYYYNKDAGKVEEISDAVFDLDKGIVSFTTNHFSTYVIGLAQIITNNPSTNGDGSGNQSSDNPSTNGNGSGNQSSDNPSTNGNGSGNQSSDNPSTNGNGSGNQSSDNPSTNNNGSSNQSSGSKKTTVTDSSEVATTASTITSVTASTVTKAANTSSGAQTSASGNGNSGTSTSTTGNTAAATIDNGKASASAADNDKKADSSKKTTKKDTAKDKEAAATGGMPKALLISLISIVIILVGTAVGMIMYDRKKKLKR